MTDKQVRMVPVPVETVKEWRRRAERRYMTSSLSEYCPEEFLTLADAYLALAALAAPSVQPDGWQDISTAPKDGTLILCLYPQRHGHDRYSLRYWSTGDWPSSGRSEGWCDQYRQLRKDDPTHWMPLPAALSDQKEEG